MTTLGRADTAAAATHDPLTGLLNRDALAERMRQALTRLGRRPESLSLIRVDLDGFARINEDFGRVIGDRLLVAVAAALTAAVRPGDTVARLGSDDFGVLCEDTSETEALSIAERLRNAIGKPIDLGLVSIEADVIVSVAHAHDATDRFDSLLDGAGRGLYFAGHTRRRPWWQRAAEDHSSSLETRVLIVDEHRLAAEALMLALQQHGVDHVALARHVTHQGVRAAAAAFGPHVAVLDSDIGGGETGVSLARLLADMGIVVVLVTGRHESEFVATCLEASAAGILDKSKASDQLMVVLNDAVIGRGVARPADRDELLEIVRSQRAEAQRRLTPFAALTRREKTVLALMMDGRSAEGISREHNVSLATVRTQIRAILQKLDVKSQVAAVALAVGAEWKATD